MLIEVYNFKERDNLRKWIKVAWGLFFLCSPYLMLAFNPNLAQSESICPSIILWGVHCTGCGLGKSMAYLSHGSISQSLEYHPLGWLTLMAIVSLTIKWLLEALGNPISSSMNKFLRLAGYGLAACLVIYHVKIMWLDISQQGLSYGSNGLIGKSLLQVYYKLFM